MLVIANASAGGADDDALATVREVLDDVADVQVVRPDGPAELARALADRDGRQVVVVGGDGSLHLTVQQLYERGELGDVTIGLVPRGTGNDFARTMGLPLESAQEAAAVVAGGASRWLDLVVDDASGVVVNAVHVGVGAEAGKQAADLKPRLGKLAYAAGAALAGVRTQGWRVAVAVDGRRVTGRRARVLMVGVANGKTVGGGTKLDPDARPDDGVVDVVVSRALGRFARMAYAIQLSFGSHTRREDVTVVRGREVRISGDPIRVNTDGEVGAPITRRTWHVLPGAWQLYVPNAPDRPDRPDRPGRTAHP